MATKLRVERSFFTDDSLMFAKKRRQIRSVVSLVADAHRRVRVEAGRRITFVVARDETALRLILRTTGQKVIAFGLFACRLARREA